jgi:hypothetical protein
MADKQQYKLIFENWRKFQSLKEKEDIEISQTPLTQAQIDAYSEKGLDKPKYEKNPLPDMQDIAKFGAAYLGLKILAGAAAVGRTVWLAKRAMKMIPGNNANQIGKEILKKSKKTGVLKFLGKAALRAIPTVGIGALAYELYSLIADTEGMSKEQIEKAIKELKNSESYKKFEKQVKSLIGSEYQREDIKELSRIAAEAKSKYPADWKKDTQFLNKVKRWSRKNMVPLDNILSLMWHETGGEMSPGTINKIGCVGLIQFCPGGGQQDVGKSGAELAAMTRSEQWDYVERYLDKNSKWKKDPANIASLYLSVFLPAFADLPNNAILATSTGTGVHPVVSRAKSKSWIQDVWAQNPANRTGTMGSITKSGLGDILKSKISNIRIRN